MKAISLALLAALVTTGCEQSAQTSDAAIYSPPALNSGIETKGMDLDVRPQDDFFAYANGNWIKNTEIPADQSYWGSFGILRNEGLGQLQTIINEVAANASPGATAAKIGDYYNAYLNVERANELGVAPLEDIFAGIDALRTLDEVGTYFGRSNELGLDAPFNLWIGQDDKNPSRYIITIWQSGLGLPNRDYYFDQSENGLELRDKYQQFVQHILQLSGYSDSYDAAARIMELETKLAEHQWDKVETRDANKNYNLYSADQLDLLLSNLNPDGYFNGLGAGRQNEVIIGQPSYLAAINKLFPTVPIGTWKEYLRLQALISYANYLSEDFVAANFEFFSKTLRGRDEQRARWKRAVASINGNLGELLGRIYVEKHFPEEARTRMLGLVDNLIKAYAESIENLEWMSDETRVQALDKLHKFFPKIGYPDSWRDYTDLEVKGDDLVGNIQRARSFAHYREVDKLGKPVDRGEWFLAPQVVNAYYNPTMNEIVFPAAILQPPFFDLNAEDARNYGAIGALIGHEIGHGFDDQGSKYDGNGNLRNWWTDRDREHFDERTARLVNQFSALEALPDLYVNGELTLGENIGDLGGVTIAYRAYEMSLDGEESPIIDGFTGQERFFLGYAQAWRAKYRDQALELQVNNNPHSPAFFRVNGIMPNVDKFYETFGVRPGDAHYLPPEERVKIWR